MCESEADESSGEDSESSSEPEMDFSHKNKKSGVSASDKITPSRSATTFVSVFVIRTRLLQLHWTAFGQMVMDWMILPCKNWLL